MDMNVSVAGILNMLERLIGENIELLWKPAANLWKVKMDPSQIDQILANLIVNTRDAISSVGKVIIETGNAEIDEAFCKGHLDFVPGKYVVLSVSDNGCGMSKEILDHIFEPFFTTKKVGEGTGLGLATVFGIVKQNDGFIDVYSEPGKGTTFKIYLPWHESKTGGIGEEYNKPKILKGTETILLVEDETALLQFAKVSLEQLGYTVLPADNPVKAIQLAGEYKEVIHLLMTDVVMPGMNGLDLRNRIISTRPGICCLFMSGYAAEIIADKGILYEDIDFLQKPFTAEALSVKVREALT
jgi:CheY-like chemotaxis protein